MYQDKQLTIELKKYSTEDDIPVFFLKLTLTQKQNPHLLYLKQYIPP